MVRDKQATGPCPKCGSGMVTCWYNHFTKNAVSIHSWEHRCADCGYRVTQAFRTDDPELDPTISPRACPYCGRHAAAG